jgi:hypothetical protein
MKIKFVMLTIIVLGIVGCTTTKNWSATGGSRSDGVIKLSYEQGMFENVQVSRQQEIELAKRRCSAWGYNNAEAFGGITKVCNEPSSSGCSLWLITKEYQCLGSLEK